MTEFLTYSGLSAVQLNEKLIAILRNVRQLIIENSLCSYPEDTQEVTVIKEELVQILRGFTAFFNEFEFTVYNSPDLISLLIANARRIEFTDDETANKDRVFGVLLVFAHFHDGVLRLKKANEYKLVIPSDDGSKWLNSWVVISGVALVCFLVGGYTHSVRPSLFQGLLKRK